MNYIHLRSGKIFVYGGENDITISDIAFHLAKINRFTGATHAFYSTAQHCCLVERILSNENPLVRKRGLLHDGHEYVIGDINTPLHREVTERIHRRFGHAYDPIEELKKEVDARLFPQFGLSPNPTQTEAALIKRADRIAFVTEASQLLDEPTWLEHEEEKPYPILIECWSHERAAYEFMRRYAEIEREIVGYRPADIQAAV